MSAVRFDPLSPARYAESALFRGVEKIVLVSATVRPKTAAMLGIGSTDMEFAEYSSTFPVERRPVIHVPSCRMTYHTEQNDELMREWLAVLDSVLSPRLALSRKGLIHAVSYRRAKFILDNSKYQASMLTHSTWNRAQVIEQFRQASGPKVLVSPSVDTGYDFYGNSARFQVIAKLPFASVSDPVIRERKKRDPDHDLYQVAQTLIQMSGRACRSESDWAETFILDDSLQWALPKMKAKGYLPKWWIDSFKSYDNAPVPIEFER
jgi:Rad3-related DNA helicase